MPPFAERTSARLGSREQNYGQGSSREVAAIAALYLSIRAVVAKSFARIHRRNLICQGILPLTFAEPTDRDGISVGDEWRIDGARAAVAAGADSLLAKGATPVRLSLALSVGERRMLLAGGLLEVVRRSSSTR